MKVKKFNHIAIAVCDLEEQISYYRDVIGLEFNGIQEIEYLHVKVAFFKCGDTEMELVCSTSEESSVSRFINKKGQGLYHIAFEVEDIYAFVEKCREHGVMPRDPEPKPGANGSTVCFLNPKDTFGVTTELVQPAT